MSNDPKKPAAPDPVLGESIPVRVLRFAAPTSGAGLNVASSVTARDQTGQAYWRLDFFPRIRHHRITWHRPNGEEPVIAFVPESRVESWDPAL